MDLLFVEAEHKALVPHADREARRLARRSFIERFCSGPGFAGPGQRWLLADVKDHAGLEYDEPEHV